MNLELVNKIKKLDAQTAIKITRLIDKMGIRDELVNISVETDNPEQDNLELSKKLFSIIISKLYLIENELYEFISEYKNITIEEAKKENIIELVKEIFNVDGAVDFLA